MKLGKIATLEELSAEIERQKKLKRDYAVNSKNLYYHVTDQKEQYMSIVDRTNGQALQTMPVTEIAHQQISKYLDIPYKYYRLMRTDNPELLASNINSWIEQIPPDQRMIRAYDGTLRAFLSSKYKRLDYDIILQEVIPILKALGSDATLESCEITESRMYLKIVNWGSKAEVTPGDKIAAGVIISNSEVGRGSLSVEPLVYRLVCSNGMIIKDSRFRKYHTGSRLQTDQDYEIYEPDTINAQNIAIMKEMRDIVQHAISEAMLDKVVEKYQRAEGMEITGDIPALIDITAKEYKLSESESHGVMEKLYQRGDYTLYGLANAITESSQQVEDYDRATELEAMGHDVVSMSNSQWSRLNNKKSSSRTAA